MKRLVLVLYFAFCIAHFAFSASPMFPFYLPWDDDSNNVTDISGLIPPNAGSNGFVYVDGNSHLATSAGRIKFWGNNLTFDGAFPTHADAEKVARRLRKFGINMIRFHHMDMWSIWDSSVDRNLSASQMDKLDYLIYQLKLNGIYSDLNMLVSRPFVYSAALGDLNPDIEQITDWKVRAVLGFFDPQNVVLQKQYASDLLTHVNPYTGNAYINEPAVAFIEINNENGFIHAFLSQQIDNLPAYYDTLLNTQWNDWLKAKYASQAALETAWGVVNLAPGSEIISNGDFSSGFLTPWLYNPQPGVVGTGTVDTGSGPSGENAALINVTTPGTADWHVQFNQGGLNVTAGTPYTITFYAKADTNRTIPVQLGMAHDPWSNLGFSANIDLTTSWQMFTFTFTPSQSDTNARINFGGMGLAANASYWFTGVSLKEGGLLGIEPGEDLYTSGINNFKRSGGPARTAEGRKDWFRFLTETEESYWVDMKDHIETTLGAQSIIFGTILGCSNPNIQANFDVIDTHSYWVHPAFPGTPWSGTDWYVRNEAMVNNPDGSTIASLAMKNVLNRPHVVSEYNHCNPSLYVAEGMFFLSAYASLQDWDAVIPFDYNSDADWDARYIGGYIQTDQDPVKMAAHAAAAGAFLRGDIAPANDTVVISVNDSQEIEADLIANAWQLVDGQVLGEDPKTALIHKVELAVEGQAIPGGSIAPGTTDVSGSVFTSDTGEIVWDTSVSGEGVMYVDTAMNKFLTGFTAGKTYYLSGVTITPGSTLADGFSSIAVTAMDSGSIAASTKTLITALGTQDNTGSVWYEYPNTPISFPPAQGINVTHRDQWGGADSVCEGVPATITLPVPYADTTVYALDNTGARGSTVTVTDAGGYAQFSIHSNYNTLWYEVHVSHPEYTATATQTITPMVSATPTLTITQTSTPATSDIFENFENTGTDQNLWGGYWYTYSDSDANTLSTSYILDSRTVPGGPVSTGAKYHVSGTAQSGGYAGCGSNLGVSGAEVDLSAYEGVQFYLRGDGSNVHAAVSTGNFTDVSAYNNWELSVASTGSWTLVQIPFSAMTQPYGTYLPFELSRGKDLQFKFEDGGSFDIEIDDIEFYYPAVPYTFTPTVTATPSITPSVTASITATPTVTVTNTIHIPSSTSTLTVTMTATLTETPFLPTLTITPSITVTATTVISASYSLRKAYAYPSLINVKNGNYKMRFVKLTQRATLQIYNMKGELVFNEVLNNPAGEYVIDLKNTRRMNTWAPGLYIYVITNDMDETVRGKFAVVR